MGAGSPATIGPAGNIEEGYVWVIVILAAIIVLVVLAVIARFFSLWLQAFFSQAGIMFTELIGMRLRKVDCRKVVLAKILLVKAGIHDITTNDLESHYLAGGDVLATVDTVVSAARAGTYLAWSEACAVDRSGRELVEQSKGRMSAAELARYVGRSGKSMSRLSAGVCDFGGTRLLCVPASGMIDAGVEVEAVRVVGENLLVRKMS